MSVEDAFPDWLRKKTKAWGPFRATNSGAVGTDWNPTMVMRHKRWCRDCNTRVGTYNEGAIPLIDAMILGKSTALSPENQKVVAAWCWRTAVSMDALDSNREMPETEPRLLRHAGAPEAMRVWIGDFNFELPHATTPATPRDTDYGRTVVQRSFGPTVTIHRLLFKVLRTDEPGGLDNLVNPAQERGHLLRVWPPQVAEVTWPPLWRYNKSGVDALGQLFVSGQLTQPLR